MGNSGLEIVVKNYRLAAAWTFIVGVIVICGAAISFGASYTPVKIGMIFIGNLEGERLVSVVLPLFAGLGIVAGIGLIIAAGGYRAQRGWAFMVAALAIAVGFVAGFPPALPTLRCGHFPYTLPLVWLPVVVTFVFLVRITRKTPGWFFLLSTLMLFSALFAAINTIACTHRILAGRGMVYLIAQPIHAALTIAWMINAIGLLMSFSWSYTIAIFLALLAIVAGAPIGIMDSIALGRFSLFSVSPLFATTLLILLWLKLKNHIGQT